METRITKQAREFCSKLFSKELSEDKQFEIFSTSMLAIATSSKYSEESLKEIWLNDNISGIDGFFILVDNALYNIYNYDILFEEENLKKFKDICFCFVEAKNTKSIDKGSILKSYTTLEKIISDNCNDEMLESIRECINKFDKESNISLKIKIYFCTQKTETDIESLKKSWQQDINMKEESIKRYIDVETIFVSSNFLSQIYISRQKGGINIRIPQNTLIRIDSKCFIGYTSVLSILEAISLNLNGDKLLNDIVFEDNIRLFLGNTNINKNIQNTIQTDNKRNNFHLYNNGLTIIAAQIEINMNDYTFKSITIINGCQTISSLFEIYKNDQNILNNITIPIKIIETTNEEEMEYIATTSNSQNQIDAYQLLSNKEFFKNLENLFNKNIINNKPIFYKRRVGQEDKNNCINIDLRIIMRALMSSVFCIPHRASGYFDDTMNKYLENLKSLNQESYCKLIYILTYMFVLVSDFLNNENKDSKLHLLKHHITFIIFKSFKSINKPRKIGDIPIFKDADIEDIYKDIYLLLSDSELFKKRMQKIIKKLETTRLGRTITTNQKVLYSPITKTIDNFENFCKDINNE